METSALLDRDLICLRCGYNLRGLARSGKCPECGTAIVRSLPGGSLAAANVRWRHGLGMGAGLMAAGVTVYVALQVMIGQGYESKAVTGRAIALSLVLSMMGLWLLTDRERNAVAMERPVSFRRIARWGILGMAGLFVVATWMELQESLFVPGRYLSKFVILLVAGGIFPLLWVLSFHIAGLAKRANRPMLAGAWRMFAWAASASGMLLLFPVALWVVYKIGLPGSELRTVMLVLPVMGALVVMAGMLGWTAWGLWWARKDK